ncbi:RNA-guided endonuclease TnpB family protein [Butyrivibrio sp. INlla21]|uniref:RNA-guided endonuclease TnpB family protein n=1 Tax=Butyrivibrio sp. INlla21 TaxID=1520811 RepID=UPI0008E3FF1E|nr:RNA-guided endonuclease TnpB family protein [Butyrivibrio sp. INlla21]SFU58046.1 transposase, IS605 OrfB family, central region [Butyrivibrio sp. INlla21]
MEFVKTAKIQIHPNNDDIQLLLNSMRAYSDACTFVSEYIFTTKDLNQVSVQKHTYNKLRDEYKLPSQMACNVVRTVIGSYKTNKTNGMNWIFCKYNAPQMTLSWNRDYSINKDKFSVGTLNGRIKCNYDIKGMEQYFDKSTYSFGTAKVVYKHDKFFLHISVKMNISELSDANVTNVVGHDRGIRFLVSSYGSNGKTAFYSGNIVKQKRGHYKALRKQLQQVGTPSSRKRIKAIGQRENRWIQDINHCISKALVESNPKGTLHVLEDLSGIRTATEAVKVHDRYVMVSWSYYDLEQKLMYKALEHGQKVIKVDPRYTSQTCPKCGHVEACNRDKVNHIFYCKNCGYKSNDDRIGAMNLYRKGIEYLVESQSSISEL